MEEHEPVQRAASTATTTGRILRGIVALAAALIAVGGIAYLTKYGRMAPDYMLFRGEPDDLRSVEGVVRAAPHRARGLIQLGILLLVMTPVARIGMTLFAFVSMRDWPYVWISCLVLVLLVLSLFGVL